MKHKSLILTAVMLISSTLHCYAFTTESGTCGKNLTWTLTDGVLTISGTGDMEDYERPESNTPSAKWTSKIPWKRYISDIKSVVVEEGVASIGNYAFYDCDNVVSLSLPDTLTDIGESAFEYCDGLTFVSLPQNITSIGRSAFEHCFELIAINLPKNLTRIEPYLFSYCENLLTVNIPEAVTYIGDGAFLDCSALTGITLPDGITEINNYTFEACVSLTDIRIPDTVTRIGDYAFSEAELTSIVIPDTVTRIGDYAFSEAELTSVVIPDSVTSIGEGAFSNCHYLADITYPEATELGLGVFSHTEFERNLPKDEYGVTYFNSRLVTSETTLTGEYTVRYGTTALEGDAFWWNKDLKSVILPDTVEYIGGFAFGMCKKLETLHIPNSVTEIDIYAFKGCENLESIYIPSSVNRIGRKAFTRCNKLKNIYYEGSAEQWEQITSIENATIHYNHTQPENPYTASMALEEYLPEGIAANKTDTGFTLSLAADCDKVIATHYSNGRLTNVSTAIISDGIAAIDIAADTDDVKVWSCDNGFDVVYDIDAEYVGTVLSYIN